VRSAPLNNDLSQTISFSQEGAKRSQQKYTITKDEVYCDAFGWLQTSLRFNYGRANCTASDLLQVLLTAVARMVSGSLRVAIWRTHRVIKPFETP